MVARNGPPKELAFYYPNPMWYRGDWVKNLILFFDGIALLVPKYMKARLDELDPAIVSGLKQHGLLHIGQPEKAVAKAAQGTIARALTQIISSGALYRLSKEKISFCFLTIRRPPISTLFPFTTLFRSCPDREAATERDRH